MALTRRDIADDFDAVDEQIAELNSHKSDVLNDYRAQLASEGMTKPQIKLEVEATKAAIKLLRAKAKDAIAVEEKGALVDEIADEISRSRARRTTRVENIEQFPAEHDEDGVFPADDPRNPSPEESAQGDDVAAEPVVSPTIQPETANEAGNDTGRVAPPVAAGHSATATTAETTNGGPHESAAHPELVNLDRRPGPTASEVGQNGSEHQRAELIETNKAPAGRLADESPATNITPIRQPKPFRPNCLNRDKCGGQGPVECWQCTKAAAANRGATA